MKSSPTCWRQLVGTMKNAFMPATSRRSCCGICVIPLALQKIASGITQIPQQDLREVAGMNAFFIVPTNWRQQVGELFMDHPPLEKRLAALAQISREMGHAVA